MSVELRELSCQNCGAPLQCPADQPIAVCPFCDTRIAASWETLAKKVELADVSVQVLPFSVAKEAFEEHFLTWLADGEMTPDDALTAALVREHSGLFLPAYRYWGSWSATWSARAGFDRTESYVDTDRKRVDGEWVEEKVEKQRTVTDWRPWTGESAGDYDLIVLVSQQVPEHLRPFCEVRETVARSELTPFEGTMLDGRVAEPPAREPDVVWNEEGLAKLDAEMQGVVRGEVQSDRLDAVKLDPEVIPGGTARVMLPFWLVAFEYQGELFHAIMDGADAARFEGKRPVDKERKQRIDALYSPIWFWLMVWIAIALLGLITFVLPGLLAVAAAVVHLAYLYNRASAEKKAIVDESKAIRQKVLARVKHEDTGVAASI